MPDRRLPLHIKPLLGGFAIHFADGRRAFIIYGREPLRRSRWTKARDLAQEVARAALNRGVKHR